MASSPSTTNLLATIQGRRSRYALNDKPSISDDRIEEILQTAIQAVPSAFNTQSTRYVVLLKDEHRKLWDLVLETLEPHIKPETREATTGRLNGFRKAYGTVLFYEDPEPVEQMKNAVPQYAHHFGTWADQTNGMNQFAIWTALDSEGLGASLQHYNPLIDQRVAQEWNVPLTWKLCSQLVFGGRDEAADPAPKPKEPAEKKVFVHGRK